MAEQTDLAALVSDICAGDTVAMQALYEKYAAQLYRFCLSRLGEVEAAQDVVQDVFVKVWHGLRAFDYRGEPAFVAWLYTIAVNVVRSSCRQRRQRPSVSLSDMPGEVGLHAKDMAGMVCERLALRQALTQLSPVQQQVIALRYDAGLSIRELSHVLKRPEGAVRSLHHRAVTRLHRIMTAEADGVEQTRLALLPA